MSSELTIRQRVNAGATWLDKTKPDWMDHVDPTTLQMSVSGKCVLSQAYGGVEWFQAKQAAGLTDGDELIDLGFNAEPYKNSEFSALNAEWKNLIATRARHGYVKPEARIETSGMPEITLTREILDALNEKLSQLEDMDDFVSATFDIGGVRVTLS